MKTGYGLNTGDTLGYLGYGAKPYSSLNYLGSKGYSSSTSAGLRTKNAKSSTEKAEVPLYKKKTYDFTDYAYREAVNRLKFLLTEAYEPTKAATSFFYRNVDVDGKSEVSDNQSVIERPSLNEVSKYFPSSGGGLAAPRYGGTLARRYSILGKDFGGVGQTASGSALKPSISNTSLQPVASVGHGLEITQPPPELLGFIEKQESYIEQLERESQYCREELSTLLKKVKDVVSENEALTDRSRSKALYQLESSESEDIEYDRGRDKGKPLAGPSIVFESRISELEAQLAQSQIDLKRLFTENEENKRKLLHGASDVGNADAYRKQVENLQRDKQNLEETVRKLQLSIDQLKDTEACNFSKSQRSRDMIEQVAFERNQAEIEIRRLKDELERQHERVREVQHEMAKRIAEERASAERRYTYHVDQLGGDLSSQWDHATKLQLEVERMKRIESDHKRELTQKNSQIDELKMEIKNKTAIFMSDLNQASAEKQSLEQEITSLRLQLERSERQSKVEVSRLNAEITSLRQRLDRADADLLQSKRENLKLGDEVASLEKELTLGELNRETRPSKELAKIISDMENKHG
ncbi:mrp4 [Anopheles darlingi]|uniref:Mrp4 n=1 Tax=Anopheles darlingi TaxID=43151 RepID=W5JM21_ANODA|nr:mrp4 [Anopheles darlingi]